MNNFEFYNPVRVIFGGGELSRVGLEAKALGNKICLVSYKDISILEPVIKRIQSLLEAEELTTISFFEIEPNPEIETIQRGVTLCREENPDVVIGVGGGSAMDAAKIIAAGVFYEENLWKMVYSRHDKLEAVPPLNSLPTIMIPTLPATGSEMNACAVISNKHLDEKSYIWGTCLYPKVAIIDPELTLTLPSYQTACAAADTISHVLEIYLNGEEDSDLQHYFQEGVMRTVMDNIEKVLINPSNLSARSHLQWAATCAINGWASPGDAWTPIHQIGHVLTMRHNVPHGASLAILMPAWMQFMWMRKRTQYRRFSKNVMQIDTNGKNDDTIIMEGIIAFKDFLRRIGVPLSLREMQIQYKDLELIQKDVIKISFGKDGLLQCTPPVTADDIMEVLKLAI